MSLLQRIVGVCTVTIDTAGGADNKALVVPYVEKSAAERIRRELFMRKSLIAQGLSPQERDERMRAFAAQETQIPTTNMPLTGYAGSVANANAPIPPWELEASQHTSDQPVQNYQNIPGYAHSAEQPEFSEGVVSPEQMVQGQSIPPAKG